MLRDHSCLEILGSNPGQSCTGKCHILCTISLAPHLLILGPDTPTPIFKLSFQDFSYDLTLISTSLKKWRAVVTLQKEASFQNKSFAKEFHGDLEAQTWARISSKVPGYNLVVKYKELFHSLSSKENEILKVLLYDP